MQQNLSGLLANGNGIALELTIDPDLLLVHGDPELVRRLLNGLINRAVSRTDKGGMIQLFARNHNDQVWISINDSGPAVNNDDLLHIFEKSFVKTSTNSSVTGLEMALVKTIIDRMGGQVWVGGQERKGCTIFVCLPAIAPIPPA